MTSGRQAWATCHAEDVPRTFPPEVVVAVKALACELPAATGAPLARWHCPDLARQAVQQGIVASVSGTTIWRWLSADAIKPWRVRSWIFPRDPAAAKASRVLDLYARVWDGEPPGDDDYVISADEKTSTQARIRATPACPPRPADPRAPSPDTPEAARCNTWPPGTCAAPKCSAAASLRPGSSRSADSSLSS